MLPNPVPKFRAHVLDLLIQALDAHEEIQRHKEDEFELEEKAPETLKQEEAACDAALRRLATFPETKKSDISAFYPPADYGLLCSYTENLMSWTTKTRTWMIKAQTEGVLPKCSKKEKCIEEKLSMNDPPAGRTDGSFERLSNQTSSILQQLVAIEKTIEEETSQCRVGPRKSLESFRSRQGVQKWMALNSKAPAATRAVDGPDTTDLEEASKTLARAIHAYKDCRWRFHQVETEHSHVVENAHWAIMPAMRMNPDDWKDMANKAIKQLLTEHRQEITDMIIQSPSIESVAAVREKIHSKLLTELEYPLQAIHLLTEISKSQKLAEGRVETQSASQNSIELSNDGEERK